MAECKYCGAETQLYDGGVPICPQCADWKDGKGPRPERKPPQRAGSKPEPQAVHKAEESTG